MNFKKLNILSDFGSNSLLVVILARNSLTLDSVQCSQAKNVFIKQRMSYVSLLFLLSRIKVIYSGTALTYSSDKHSDLEASRVLSFMPCRGANDPQNPAHFLNSFLLQLGTAG